MEIDAVMTLFPDIRGVSAWACLLSAASLLALPPSAHAAPYAQLAQVKPVARCEALTHADLHGIAETPASVASAEMIDTPKGAFCKVISHIDPAIVVTTYLPAQHWTQRYYQAAGSMAGPDGYPEAGTCQPALNGEFVYARSNQHFTMVLGDRDTPGWKPDPQKRIDYAYRANHVTALVSKALIRAYYGQAQKYAYFMGCSEGGREALVEAQRFPGDFDGISAGAPGYLATAQESLFHVWKYQSNRRADGTNILLPAKLAFLHEQVIAHCDTLSGVKDGLLADPSACHFNPAAMPCAPGQSDGCFTAEEAVAINRLYDGAHDAQGNAYYWGLQRGSELAWGFPATATAPNPNALVHALQLAYILSPTATPALANPDNVSFGKAEFARAATLSPLFDAGDTDLHAFAATGGKLILWHGLSDVQIPAEATMAYYRALQTTMGKAASDRLVRAFFLPGVGHCGGGDGFDKIDVLSALMAWVETKQAPTQLESGKVAPGMQTSITPATALALAVKPYATPRPPVIATRPVYPFPSVARYVGTGDPASAANYVRVARPDSYAPTELYAATTLIGPNIHRDYVAKDGQVEAVAH